MIKIPLTQGKFALIDDEDWPAISGYKWHAAKFPHTFYAKSNIPIGDGKGTTIRMHSIILCPNTGQQVDHINHNGLDNRRNNLRLCTNQQNQGNRRKWKPKSSLYKGVFWDKQKNKFRASIRRNMKLKHLGCFHDEIEAAKAYDIEALKHFGEFALINFKEG